VAIVRTVLCYVVYHNCTVICYAQPQEQVLQVNWAYLCLGLALDLTLCFS